MISEIDDAEAGRTGHAEMTPADYKAAVKRLGYTQQGFAVLIDAGARSGQYWARKSVPRWVATILRLIERRPEIRSVLEAMAVEDGREWRSARPPGRPRRSQLFPKPK